jgi:hypothetical protein
MKYLCWVLSKHTCTINQLIDLPSVIQLMWPYIFSCVCVPIDMPSVILLVWPCRFSFCLWWNYLLFCSSVRLPLWFWGVCLSVTDTRFFIFWGSVFQCLTDIFGVGLSVRSVSVSDWYLILGVCMSVSDWYLI